LAIVHCRRDGEATMKVQSEKGERGERKKEIFYLFLFRSPFISVLISFFWISFRLIIETKEKERKAASTFQDLQSSVQEAREQSITAHHPPINLR
jgi:hypothetical protein